MGGVNGIFNWRKGKGLSLKIRLKPAFTQAIQQLVSTTTYSYF
jgi:hypothetical protein